MKRINIFSVKQVKEKSGIYELDSGKISCPRDVHELCRVVLDLNNEACEKFGIITLDSKNKIAGVHIISIGSLDAAIVHPREVMKAAILNNAASFICFHNHPSGDPTPSPEDILTTKRFVEVGELMGIECLDHVIVGDDRFVSLKELGSI